MSDISLYIAKNDLIDVIDFNHLKDDKDDI